jgi:two-component system, OmpR family, response regulator
MDPASTRRVGRLWVACEALCASCCELVRAVPGREDGAVTTESTIVVIEDDPAIADLLAAALRDAGHRPLLAATGMVGVDLASRHDPSMVVIDIGLPDIDGFEVCRRIRDFSDIPVLFLTARGDEVDRIVAFELGADDYVTKPFMLREVMARVRAILRRGQRHASHDAESVEIGQDLVLDRTRREVTRRGDAVALAGKEFELLEHLVSNTGRALSRRQLLEAVWDPGFVGSDRTVDVHISHLRRKLGDDLPLATVYGLGYRLG